MSHNPVTETYLAWKGERQKMWDDMTKEKWHDRVMCQHRGWPKGHFSVTYFSSLFWLDWECHSSQWSPVICIKDWGSAGMLWHRRGWGSIHWPSDWWRSRSATWAILPIGKKSQSFLSLFIKLHLTLDFITFRSCICETPAGGWFETLLLPYILKKTFKYVF